LVPRQLKQTGLTPKQVTFTPEALRHMISRYTREAGVRELERTIGRAARKVARRVAEGQPGPFHLDVADLADLLGQERVRPERSRQGLPPGVATGLAWTESGGDVLYIEAALLPHERGLRLTGQLGKVMKESARAAQSFVWAHADALGIDEQKLRTSGVHVRSEEHTSELQSLTNIECRLLLLLKNSTRQS